MASLGAGAQGDTSAPTINFDRVTDRIIVGSCMRNAADLAKAREGGAAVIFSLQDSADISANQLDMAAITAAAAAAGLRHVQCGTSDTDEEELRRNLPGAVATFAREMEALPGSGGAAYIHCNGGRGRAPTVVVAFLYWLAGQTLAEAAATMTAGRESKPKLAVVAAATADLLGAAGQSQETLTEAERAAIKAKLGALASAS